MKKPAAAVIGVCTLLLVAACGSSSSKTNDTAEQEHSITAKMTPQAVVTPQGKPFAVPASLADATGDFSATLSNDDKLSWHISYAKLGNPQLVVGDIHIGPPKEFGPVLVRVCSSCKPDQDGVLKLKASVARQLTTGQHWLTLITDKYPNGAVRGQIAVK